MYILQRKFIACIPTPTLSWVSKIKTIHHAPATIINQGLSQARILSVATECFLQQAPSSAPSLNASSAAVWLCAHKGNQHPNTCTVHGGIAWCLCSTHAATLGGGISALCGPYPYKECPVVPE